MSEQDKPAVAKAPLPMPAPKPLAPPSALKPPAPAAEPGPLPATTGGTATTPAAPKKVYPPVIRCISDFMWTMNGVYKNFKKDEVISDYNQIVILIDGGAPVVALDDKAWTNCPNCKHIFKLPNS